MSEKTITKKKIKLKLKLKPKRNKAPRWNQFQSLAKKDKITRSERSEIYKTFSPKMSIPDAYTLHKAGGRVYDSSNYMDITALKGTYLVKFPDKVAREITFLPRSDNLNQIRLMVKSDEIETFFDGGIVEVTKIADAPVAELSRGVASTTNADLSQKLLRSVIPGVASHCVGKDGICRVFRKRADEIYLKNKIDKAWGTKPDFPLAVYLRGSQKKRYVQFMRIALDLERMFFEKYPEGITVEELDKVCIEYKIKGTIHFPYFREHYALNKTIVKPLISFRFKNVATDHVEIILNEDEVKFVHDDEFNELYESYKKKDGNKNMLKVHIMGSEIYAFLFSSITYCKESHSSFFDPESPLRVWVGKMNKYRVKNTVPYYDFLKSCTRIPTHYNSGLWTNKDQMDVGKLGLDNFAERKIAEGTWYGQDMKKAYTQWNSCKYFNHFPGLPNYDEHNPGDKFKKEEGWWFIKSDDKLPHWGKITGYWTSIHLRHFLAHGAKFEVLYGMWSTMKCEVDEFSEEILNDKRKLYVVAIGMLCQERRSISENWYDPENALDRTDENSKHHNYVPHIKQQVYTNKEWCSVHTVASYIYACASTQILDQALKTSNVVAIKIDSIISDKKLAEDGLFKGAEIQTVETAQKTMWTDYVVNNYSNYIVEHRTDFPTPWAPLKTKMSMEISNLPLVPLTTLTGLGGSGKSTCVGMLQGHLNPLYIAPTRKLRDDKADLFNERVCMAGIQQKLAFGCPSFYVVDEIGLTSNMEKEIFSKLKEGVRVILIGDEAQLNSRYCLEDLWDVVKEKSDSFVEFKIDRRSKGSKLKVIKAKLREIVLDKITPLDERIKQVRLILHRANFTYLSKEEKDTIPVMKFYSDKEQKGNERWLTVDKYQGSDISVPTLLWINANTGRKEEFCELVYTMIGRFKNFSDIRVSDVTGFEAAFREQDQ